jgi:hypothetical protein
MAEITLTSEVTGITQVDTQRFKGTIVKFWEVYTNPDNPEAGEKFRLWSAWFTHDQTINFNEKDIIKVTGNLSCSVGSYTPKNQTEAKAIVNYNLNNCKVSVVKEVAPKPTETPVSLINDDEVPF